MIPKSIPLSQLKEGEGGTITALHKGDLSLKLMELGLVPGETIRVDRIAPLGDPISIQLGTYLLSLRKDEAKVVMVQP